MERSLEELEAIVRERICRVCSDRTVDGQCGLENPSDCSLFRMFPQVARAIQATQSDDIRQYVQSIRDTVCVECRSAASNGTCDTRREVRCALDAYLLLVVDAIEEATGKTFDRSALGKPDYVEVRL